MGRSKGKPLTQFNARGTPIQHYSSILEAAETAGIDNRGISMAAHGKIHMYHGYFWRFGYLLRKLELRDIKRKKPVEIIHQTLRKRLKIKKINAGTPAFLNLSVKTMKGEKWKDVPGYEGLYQVSSFGRVKALQKITGGKQRKWRPEQIQRIVIDFRKDKRGKEIAGTAFASMVKPGSKKLVSVARWVYYLFVQKFDIKNPTTQIRYKDKNTLNLHYKNLICVER